MKILGIVTYIAGSAVISHATGVAEMILQGRYLEAGAIVGGIFISGCGAYMYGRNNK